MAIKINGIEYNDFTDFLAKVPDADQRAKVLSSPYAMFSFCNEGEAHNILAHLCTPGAYTEDQYNELMHQLDETNKLISSKPLGEAFTMPPWQAPSPPQEGPLPPPPPPAEEPGKQTGTGPENLPPPPLPSAPPATPSAAVLAKGWYHYDPKPDDFSDSGAYFYMPEDAASWPATAIDGEGDEIKIPDTDSTKFKRIEEDRAPDDVKEAVKKKLKEIAAEDETSGLEIGASPRSARHSFPDNNPDSFDPWLDGTLAFMAFKAVEDKKQNPQVGVLSEEISIFTLKKKITKITDSQSLNKHMSDLARDILPKQDGQSDEDYAKACDEIRSFLYPSFDSSTQTLSLLCNTKGLQEVMIANLEAQGFAEDPTVQQRLNGWLFKAGSVASGTANAPGGLFDLENQEGFFGHVLAIRHEDPTSDNYKNLMGLLNGPQGMLKFLPHIENLEIDQTGKKIDLHKYLDSVDYNPAEKMVTCRFNTPGNPVVTGTESKFNSDGGSDQEIAMLVSMGRAAGWSEYTIKGKDGKKLKDDVLLKVACAYEKNGLPLCAETQKAVLEAYNKKNAAAPAANYGAIQSEFMAQKARHNPGVGPGPN